jgi:hypothetical protein
MYGGQWQDGDIEWAIYQLRNASPAAGVRVDIFASTG